MLRGVVAVARRWLAGGAALVLGCVAQGAAAGPPFLTDDPEPTDTGHFEIYAPVVEAEGRGPNWTVETGAEVNYGAAPDLQLTADLPVVHLHEAGHWRSGLGDLEVAAKYRFFHDEKAGLQVAFFPALTLPTATHAMGAGKVTAFLPVWAQEDFGPWSIFGGGGLAINPGAGNRDYWTEGAAITRSLGDHLLLGAEADRQGADTIGGSATTSLGVGAIYALGGPFRLLASGGPTFADAGGPASVHLYVALGLDY